MIRYILAILFAFVITYGLFLGMRYLIINKDNVIEDGPQGRVIDFVRLKKDESFQTKKRKPKKPPKPKQPPPPIEQPAQQAESLNGDMVNVGFTAEVLASTNLKSGLSLDTGDGEYLPIVKVAPVYPRRALSRGIEGYVVVEFVVTSNGSVRAPKVVEAKPEGIFNQAAKNAVLKFKYKPRVVDGQATEVAGVRNKITFKMK
ncbi:MAG: energy transducer TonB [Enterobacterales bacterium]|nr:energy transducer TonB [Enterobacterales bacterium]